jgi:ribosomal protein S18 acetylase RimI-like enzyme
MAPTQRRITPTSMASEEAKPDTARPEQPECVSSPPLPSNASTPAAHPTDQTSQTPHTAHIPQVKALLASESCSLHPYTSHPAGELTFDLRAAADLTPTDLQSCIDIVEATSGAAYRASSIGWNARHKREEMLEQGMVYVLVRRRASAADDVTIEQHPKPQEDAASSGTPWPSTPIVALLSFLPTTDDPPSHDRPVLYIYELHLHPSLRRLGLGTALIRFVEACARVMDISKTMLTVFASNEAARAVYARLGYVRDRASPPVRVRRTRGGGEKVVPGGYEILSKELEDG